MAALLSSPNIDPVWFASKNDGLRY
uniref:Uncharacterized protein n=1 Tax=Arundo donax TaxID=35708 RepID=A0A0A9D3A2_ARUDO